MEWVLKNKELTNFLASVEHILLLGKTPVESLLGLMHKIIELVLHHEIIELFIYLLLHFMEKIEIAYLEVLENHYSLVSNSNCFANLVAAAAENGGVFTSPEIAKSFDFANEERIYKW